VKTTNKENKSTQIKDTDLTITRVFDAPRERVCYPRAEVSD